MNFYFVMNVRFPTEKAHGWQIAKMAEAVLKSGRNLTLVIPDRENRIKESAETYYGLPAKLPIVRLPMVDLFAYPWVPRVFAFAVFELSFLFSFWRWSSREKSPAVVVTRDQFLAAWFRRPGWKVAFEMHDIAKDFFERHRRLGRNADAFIVTNQWKKDRVAAAWGNASADRTLVLPNGVDLKAYEHLPSRETARQKLGWDAASRYAVYTGHLYDWKGAEILAEASRFLPEDWKVVCVGGTPEDGKRFAEMLRAKNLDRVALVPHVPHAEVLNYLAAADCLAVPNSARSPYSQTTSPLKLWEYLAARRPVVVSDLPAMRERVGETEVVFASPDDPQALAKAIEAAVRHPEARIQAGWKKVQTMDWTSRAEKMLSFLGV